MKEDINGIIVDGKVYIADENPSNECRHCDLQDAHDNCIAPAWCQCYDDKEFCSYDFKFSQTLTDKLNKQ